MHNYRPSLLLWLGLKLNLALTRFGLRLARYPAPAERRRLQLMRSRQISTLVDIGANAGQYASLVRDQGYRGSIISFEPLPAAYERLARQAAPDSLWRTENKAVSDRAGPLTLHVSSNLVSSSILSISHEHTDAAPLSQTMGEVLVSTISLDEILRPLRGERVMIKIDTQGYERAVLQSGSQFLHTADLIELELSLVELYHGQALFRELDSMLVDKGFDLVSIEEGFFNEDTGRQLQFDGIYIRRNS